MKSYLVSFLVMILVLGCSQGISESRGSTLVITSEREIISDLESLENHLFQSLSKSSVQNISLQDVFEDSWLSSIKTDYSLDKPVSVEIKEHHPIANIGRDRFLTQRGKSINPKGIFKKIRVISINGDGSFQINIQELQTLQTLNLPIKIFVLNNKGYGIIKQFQKQYIDSRFIGTIKKDSSPNFKKIANAYNIKFFQINNQKDIKLVINDVLKSKGPSLCEVLIDPNQPIIPKLKYGDSL